MESAGKKTIHRKSAESVTIGRRKIKQSRAAKLNAAGRTDQMIIVAARGSRAQISMHQRNKAGVWVELFKMSGYIGRNGTGKRTEGDGRTPAGIYSFTKAFGIKPNPGTVLAYTKLKNCHYWVDDPRSSYYNQFVSTKKVRRDWSSAEHLAAAGRAYNYVLALDYNKSGVPYAGSAIFLHCSMQRATAGCITVPEEAMVQIMRAVNENCIIIIDERDRIDNY